MLGNTSKDTPISVLPALYYLLFLHPFALIQANSPAPSPEASTELICHTQHASECYPAIFQPTEHFQPIHHDQSLTAGLHVRMNLATGVKEARMNVPDPPDTPPADLIIIDNPLSPKFEESLGEIAEEAVEDAPLERMRDPSNPDRDYPYIPSHFDAGESSLFASSTSTLRSSSPSSASEALLSSLKTLTELCHDYHWGSALTQDAELATQLIYTVNPSTAGISVEIRSHAALLLGTAVQNNPDALTALFDNTNGDDPSQTAIQSVLATLWEPVEGDGDPVLHRRTMFLLSQLANDPLQLQIFLTSNGLHILHKLFNLQTLAIITSDNPTFVGDGSDKLRAKIANFMYDHVLPAFYGKEGRRLASQIVHQENTEIGPSSEPHLVQILEPWSIAFSTAQGEYAAFFYGKEEGEASVKYATYQSVWEATELLKKVLNIP